MADEKNYYVELPMQVSGASDPEEAVEAFIDQIVTFGQRAWTYLVTDEEGNTVKVSASQPFHASEQGEEGPDAEPERPAEGGKSQDQEAEGDSGGTPEGSQEAGTATEEREG